MMTRTTLTHRPVGWRVQRPWATAVGLALVPVIFSALGLGGPQAAGASERTTYLVAAASIALCAVIGILVMVRARPSLAEFGLRTPRNLGAVLWLIPAALVPVLVGLASGYAVSASLVPGFVALAIAVAVSEEVFYRGLVLSLFRERGPRYAVVASSTLFAVLHLANLAGGKSVGYAVLQLVFAALFGLVAAQIVVITGSLWPAIGWHFVYDLVAYLGGDAMTSRAVVAALAACVVLAAYAVYLWRGIPREIGP